MDTLPSSVDQLPDPDSCAEIVLIWIYAGLVVHPFHKLLRSEDKRDRLIVERYELGESRAAIAADYGLTVRRIGISSSEPKHFVPNCPRREYFH